MSGRRGLPAGLVVFLGYAALSFGYLGWRLLPHPGRELVGVAGENDASIFVWSFAWWPHAILHGLNPFVSHALYAPTGFDLASATTVPGLAIVFSPLTLLFGPSVSYNIACLLMPVLSAWTAYLLLRYLTGSLYAAVVGGYLYGFSSYVLAQQTAGHLHTTSIFLVPLLVLTVVRHLRDEIGNRSFVLRTGGIVALQAYCSTEVAITVTLALAVSLVLAWVFVRELRGRLRALLAPLAGGFALAGALAAPLVYFALTGLLRTPVYTELFDGDLLNLIVPTKVSGIGGQAFASITAHFPGEDVERDSYLGPPILLIGALLVRRTHRTSATRFLLAAFAAGTILSLGRRLTVDGSRLFPLPWALPAQLTGLADVIPSRIAIFATLAACTMVALWIASTPGRVFTRPYVLPALAVVALVPPFWSGNGVFHPNRLAFFSDGLYKACIPKGESLLVFPFGPYGESQLWQAEAGFAFDLAEGSMGHKNFPQSFAADPTIEKLLYSYYDATVRPGIVELHALALRRHVDRVVAVITQAYPTGTEMHAFGPLQVVGDVYVAPACGYDSLAGDRRPAP